jgi:geranylgeranyl pyrophosphate synthase
MTSAVPLPAVVRPLTPVLELCEERLRRAVAGHASEVVRPAADTLAAGGKRVRPLLVFCAAPRAGLEDGRVLADLLSAASAVELVHMATLVHDDLLDGATMRRGRPTVARELGADRAVSTGDYLFARAFAELTRARSPRAVQALAGAALDLSRGEMDQQRAAFDFALTEDAYLSRCRRKTAALFSVACRLGALVGGAGAQATERLAAFGENVGMAFQIFDDILDLAGAPAKTGKRRGTDLCDGTVTLPVIIALRLEPGLRPHLADACAGPALEHLCDRLAAHPALEIARGRALEFVATARRAIQEGPSDGADVVALLEVADGVVDRFS